MTVSKDFYRDEKRGEFRGNILIPLSTLFPASLTAKMCARPWPDSRWLLTVRTLRDGSVGYLFWIEPRIVNLLNEVFEELYKGFPRDVHYPGIFNEGHNGGLPLVCLAVAGEDRMSVWLKGKTADKTDVAEPSAVWG